MGVRGSETAGSREGRGLCGSGWGRGTLVEDVFDVQLGDRAEEMLVIISHGKMKMMQDGEAVVGL